MAMSDVTNNGIILESMSARGIKLADGAAALERECEGGRLSVGVMGGGALPGAVIRRARARLRLSVERDCHMRRAV